MRISLLFALLALAGLVSGCGTDTPVTTPTVNPLGKVSGRLMGGELPITGATISLYTTAVNTSISNGTYVGTANLIASQTSGSGGSWDFTGTTYTCLSSQLVYVVGNGGNAGGGTNPNILEVALVGQCGALNNFTTINELTSLASAYALSSFMSINISSTPAKVNITAPAANNSITSNISSTATTTATTASGLLHAYQNAINLVSMSNGTAYMVPPGNAGAIAPGQMMNTLGNLLEACVNSAGGAEGDNSSCGNLFKATPNLAGAYPINTLQSALNLARNPYISASNVTTLYSLSTPMVAFSPALASAPKDWTVAISYPVPPNPATGLGFPFTVALDPDDNVYVTSPEADPYVPNASYTTSSNSASACLFGFTSNGTLLPTVVPYTAGTVASVPGTPGNGTAGSSTWYCASGAAATNPTLFTVVNPDALGNVWIANLTPSGQNTSTTASENLLLKVTSASRSTATAYMGPGGYAPRSIAIDNRNDVVFTDNGGSNTVQHDFCLTANGATGPAASGNGSCTFLGFAGTANLAQAANWIAFDNSQNLWAAQYDDVNFITGTYPGYGGGFGSLTNSTPTGSPTYGGGWLKKSVDSGNVVNAPGEQENSAPFGMAMDSTGTPWMSLDAPQNGGTNSLPVGLVKGVVTGGQAGSTPSTNTITTLGLVSPKWLESDGNNVMWIADTGGIVAYATTANPNVVEISQAGGFSPCIPSGTACTYPDFSSTKGIAIDSTGSVWFTTPDVTTTVANANRLIQIVGTASPTWPMLGVVKPGTMPQ